jgi:hypothetical protein
MIGESKLGLKFRGVEVIAAAGACAAARMLTGMRLLTAEAPRRLPLETCDRPAACRCIYRHFDERRQGPRREDDYAKVPLAHRGVERRTWRGRRDSDYE